jgi:hypothetical protein
MDWSPVFSEFWKVRADNRELQLQGVKWKEPRDNEEGAKFGFEADLISEGRNYGVLKLDYWVGGRVKYNVELRSAVQVTYTLELCTDTAGGTFFLSKYLHKIENLHLGPENLVPQITVLSESLKPVFRLSFYELAPWDENTRKFNMRKVKGLEIRDGDPTSLFSCKFGDFELQADQVVQLDPTVAVTPSDDASVDESDPTSNLGLWRWLYVESTSANENWRMRSFLKFDLSSIPENANIISAKLHLYCLGVSYVYHDYQPPPTGVLVEVCEVEDDSWDESTITWQNQPKMGLVIATLPWKTSPGWMENDVTYWVRANPSDGLVSIGLRMRTEVHEQRPGISFYSKEYDGLDPRLEITYQAGTAVEAKLLDDAYVSESDPASNFGTSEILCIQSSRPSENSRMEGFLKFDLSGIPDGMEIVNAKLHLYAPSISWIGRENLVGILGKSVRFGMTLGASPPSIGRIGLR